MMEVEELTSMYGAKLQHEFLAFSSGVFLQKRHNRALKQNICGNKTSIGR